MTAIHIVLGCAACSSTEPAADTLPGTYALVSIDGSLVPNLVDGWGTRSAVLKIESDGTFVETIDYVRPPGYEPTEEIVAFPGVWSEKAGTYDFLWTTARAVPTVGILSGRTLTLRAITGAERVYRK